MTTPVIDTADWSLAQPIQATGGVDFSGTPLTVAFRPILGGAVIDTASSDDGTLVFVPASGQVGPYFAIDLRVENRTWRTKAPVLVRGDILRHPDPTNLARTEWIGRVDLKVLPGSDSSGIGVPGYAPVLIPAQPYDGRLVSAPMVVGPQGIPGRAGGDAFVHTQTALSASWIIPHTLGRRPGVAVFSAAGELLLAEVSATDTTVSVVHASPATGFVTLT